MPKNESKTDQRDTQISTGCSNVRGRTRQSPAMQLSRPPVGWESSPSSAMSPQNRKGNHATTASRRQPRRSLPADEGASIPLHQFRPLSSPACPPTAPRMGQPPQKECGSPAILAGVFDRLNQEVPDPAPSTSHQRKTPVNPSSHRAQRPSCALVFTCTDTERPFGTQIERLWDSPVSQQAQGITPRSPRQTTRC